MTTSGEFDIFVATPTASTTWMLLEEIADGARGRRDPAIVDLHPLRNPLGVLCTVLAEDEASAIEIVRDRLRQAGRADAARLHIEPFA